jgi:hypothetical protein
MANQYRENFEYTYTPLPLEKYAEFVKKQQEVYDANIADLSNPYGWKGGIITGSDGTARERSDYYNQKREALLEDYMKHKNNSIFAKGIGAISGKMIGDKILQDVIADEKLSPAAYAAAGDGTGASTWKKYDPTTGEAIGNINYQELGKTGKSVEEILSGQVAAPTYAESIEAINKMPDQKKAQVLGLTFDSNTNSWKQEQTGETYKSFDEAFYSGNPYINQAWDKWVGQNYDEQAYASAKYHKWRFGDNGRESYIKGANNAASIFQSRSTERDVKYITPKDGGDDSGSGKTGTPLAYNYDVQKITVGFDATNDKANYGYNAVTEYEMLEDKKNRGIITEEESIRLNNITPFVQMVQQVQTEFYDREDVQAALLEKKRGILTKLGFATDTINNSQQVENWFGIAREFEDYSEGLKTEQKRRAKEKTDESGKKLSEQDITNWELDLKVKKAKKAQELINRLQVSGIKHPVNNLEWTWNQLADTDEELKEKYLQPAIDVLPNSTDVNVYRLEDTNAGNAAAAQNVTEARNAISAGHVSALGMQVSTSEGGDGFKGLELVKPEAFLDKLEANWDVLPGKKIELQGIRDNAYMVLEYNSLASDGDVYTNNASTGKPTEGGTTRVLIPINEETIGKMNSLVKGQGQYGTNSDITTNSGIFAILDNYETYHNTSGTDDGVGGNKDWYSNSPDFVENFYEMYGVKSTQGKSVNVVDELKNQTGMAIVKGHKLRDDIANQKFVSIESSILPTGNGTDYVSGRIIYKGVDGKNNKPITLTDVLKEGLIDSQINVDPNDGAAINVTIGSGDYATTFINSAMKYTSPKNRANIAAELGDAFDNGANTSQITDILTKYGVADKPFVFSSKTMANVYLWSGDAIGKK